MFEFSAKRHLRGIAIAGLLLGCTLSRVIAQPAVDPNAYVTVDLNLRAGPDADYPSVLVIPAQAYVTLNACLPELTWCEIYYEGNRGWAAANYIRPYFEDRYWSVSEYAALIDLPMTDFDLRTYWSAFYSDEPFYGEVDLWTTGASTPSVNSFYEPLAHYGYWVDMQGQFAWVPRDVDRTWRPYTRGHWSYTDQYGWFWVSDEPFGWATYHYGRWGFASDVGWYWVPGTRWAPAWVAWRESEDYFGWAPLPPDDRVGIEIEITSVPDYHWQFVPASSFLSINLFAEVVRDDRRYQIIRDSRPRGKVRVANQKVVNDAIKMDEVERKTRKKVVVQRAPDRAVEVGRENSIGKVGVFRPPAPRGKSPPNVNRRDEIAARSKTKEQSRDPSPEITGSIGVPVDKGPPPPPPTAKKKSKAADDGRPAPPLSVPKKKNDRTENQPPQGEKDNSQPPGDEKPKPEQSREPPGAPKAKKDAERPPDTGMTAKPKEGGRPDGNKSDEPARKKGPGKKNCPEGTKLKSGKCVPK